MEKKLQQLVPNISWPLKLQINDKYLHACL